MSKSKNTEALKVNYTSGAPIKRGKKVVTSAAPYDEVTSNFPVTLKRKFCRMGKGRASIPDKSEEGKWVCNSCLNFEK